jgi:hypothetical protein
MIPRVIACASALWFGIGTQALAGIVGTPTGAITIIPAPPSVRDQAIVSDTEISLFAERQGVVLPQALNFNITQPTTAPGATTLDTTPGTIPAGIRVDSYYVYLQSISGTQEIPVVLSGSFTFDRDVLGIAIFNTQLNQSDPILGLPGTLYPTGGERDLDVVAGGIVGIGPNDSITLSEDRRTVTLNLGNAGGGDQLRIVTESVPEPSTLVLAATASLAAVAWFFRQRRSWGAGLTQVRA